MEGSATSSTEEGFEGTVRKLLFWLDTVATYLSSSVACLGGDFNQDAVIAHIKVRFICIDGISPQRYEKHFWKILSDT